MKNATFRNMLAVLLGGAFLTQLVRAGDGPLAWPPVTAQTKPWAYNWWMASAVDRPQR